MTHLVLIESGEPVGYVDTEELEVEYNGDSDIAAGALERIEDRVSLGMSEDDLYGEEVYLEGERVEEYVRNMEEHDDVPFTVKKREETDN